MRHTGCEGCIYFNTTTFVGGTLQICDYIGMTGHARSLICPPGEGCTVKTTRGKPSAVAVDRGGYPARRREREC